MKIRRSVILASLALGLVLVLVLVGTAVGSRPARGGPGPLQVTPPELTHAAGDRRLAVFTVINTNPCPVVFRAFGPQVRGDDGSWPTTASAWGAVQRLPGGSTGRLEVVAPGDAVPWRIQVAYERAPRPWDGWMTRARSALERLGFARLLATGLDEEPARAVQVEVERGQGRD